MKSGRRFRQADGYQGHRFITKACYEGPYTLVSSTCSFKSDSRDTADGFLHALRHLLQQCLVVGSVCIPTAGLIRYLGTKELEIIPYTNLCKETQLLYVGSISADAVVMVGCVLLYQQYTLIKAWNHPMRYFSKLRLPSVLTLCGNAIRNIF